MPVRVLGWIAALMLATACSLIFNESPRDGGAGDDSGIVDPSCMTCASARSDSCRDGACVCGPGPECAPGQECQEGRCACTTSSCLSGCCGDDGLCRDRTFTSCGDEGESCKTCDVLRDDTCSGSGLCRCGENTRCAPGLRCDGGTCICTPESCANGCCREVASGVFACDTSGADTACGLGGSQCFDCEGTDGSDCVNGACSSCALDCKNGCCSGIDCIPAADDNPAACGGTSGDACQPCGTTADGCSPSGVCTCGSGPACSPGQECDVGVCKCTANSCLGGCCSQVIGGICITDNNVASCGLGGVECQSCGSNQRCDQDGNCVCDAISCPDGCCTADRQCAKPGGTDNIECGIGGIDCVACAEGQVCGPGGICACNDSSCEAGCCDFDTGTCTGLPYDGGVCATTN